MSQSELRNFEKSMAYHLAPAMLGINGKEQGRA